MTNLLVSVSPADDVGAGATKLLVQIIVRPKFCWKLTGFVSRTRTARRIGHVDRSFIRMYVRYITHIIFCCTHDWKEYEYVSLY